MITAAERIINLTLDQEVYHVFRSRIDEDRRMGAYILANNLRMHFKRHIHSFYGKTMFYSKDGIERIKDILNRKMGVYIRRFDNAKEKAGAVKMYKHIQREINKIIQEA